MEKIILNNGIEMPLLGIGLHQIANLQECEDTVLFALETGYRLIDTAAAYQNEEAVGRAIKRSKIPREDLFVSTKLWVADTSYEKAKRAFDLSLKNLKLDYVDLYLIHLPFNDVHGAWRAMEEMLEEGKIKAIGLSNFEPYRVMDIMAFNKIVPAVNQIETHPFYQRLTEHSFHKENNIQHMSWAPFAQGKNDLFNNRLLKDIGDRYKKSVSQVVLRWLIQRNIVTIPKSVTKDRIQQNFEVFDFELSEYEMGLIKSLDLGKSSIIDQHDPNVVKAMANW